MISPRPLVFLLSILGALLLTKASGEEISADEMASHPQLEPELPTASPLPPNVFNPDPGGSKAPETELPDLFLDTPIRLPDYGTDALPADRSLPRDVKPGTKPIDRKFEYREQEGVEDPNLLPLHSEPIENRWFIGFGKWQRYSDPSHETAYQTGDLKLFHPYLQSTLKGDAPIIGQDIFLSLTAKSFTLAEYRRLPVPSAVSAARPNSAEFFGRGEQILLSNDTSFTIELFKGETAFKPIEWAVRITPVFNINYIQVKENNLVDPDPRGPGFKEPKVTLRSPPPKNPGDPVGVLGDGGLQPANGDFSDGNGVFRNGTHYTRRTKNFFALQEFFVEWHLHDLSDNYDFVAVRFGNQPFNSDFRGFIFNDTNFGLRIFGNADNNRLQYNFAWFAMREKDTYSDLNTFDSRHQNVFIANVYRQDFLWKGYTAQWSLHANFDDADRHYDQNDFVVRPSPIGDVRDHAVRAFYLGWAGEGHIDRLNVSHSFYQVFGEDRFNGIAGRSVEINAQMASLELSYDVDWARYKFSLFYASGDHDARDGKANGFDTILDNPFFLNGPFSYFVHQGINLGGTAVNLKQRDSLPIDLRSSKTEGQANFVNPGTFITGIGGDFDVTPKIRAFANLNYIWMVDTNTIETVLLTNKASNDLGLDASIGFQWRPLLTDNIIVSIGAGVFIPGQGYKDIYRQITQPVPGFTTAQNNDGVDSFLLNGFLTVTLTY